LNPDFAVALPVERDERRQWAFEVRHLERLLRGTSYPDQVKRIAELVGLLEAQGSTTLVVDQTGVGRPVVDMLRDARLSPIAVTITGGDTLSQEGREYRVPKRDLVSAVQVALQAEQLKIAASLPLAKTLADELLAFKVSISLSGHDAYGNDVGQWREAPHDDLVLAVALACWWGKKNPPVTYSFSRVPSQRVDADFATLRRRRGRW